MIEIFFSIITEHCVILLLKDNNLVSFFKKIDKNLHSENFVKNVNKVVSENGFSFSDLEKIYFVSEPGSQTGQRISFSFVAAMEILSKNIKIFSIEGLLFQKGSFENCLSIIGSNRIYFVAEYKKNSLFSKDKISEISSIREELKIENKTSNVLINFEEIDFVKNFFFLKGNFNKFKS